MTNREVRPSLDECILRNGRKIYLIGKGRLANLVAAEGHPPEVMAQSFSNQILSLLYILKNHKKMGKKTMIVPKEIDRQDVDDKIINRAKEQGESPTGISSKYIQTYFEDSDRLNIRRATNYPKATEHIDDMINLIQKLVDNESAYVSKNGVYFRVSKFLEYGKLSKKKTEDLESGALT